MKCPICGAEMQAGSLRGRIAWLPEDAEEPVLSFRRGLKAGGGFFLTDPPLRAADGRLRGFLCRACKQGWFAYEKER